MTLVPAHSVRRLHLEQAPAAFQVGAGSKDLEQVEDGGLQNVVLGRPGQLARALTLLVAVAALRHGSEKNFKN